MSYIVDGILEQIKNLNPIDKQEFENACCENSKYKDLQDELKSAERHASALEDEVELLDAEANRAYDKVVGLEEKIAELEEEILMLKAEQITCT